MYMLLTGRQIFLAESYNQVIQENMDCEISQCFYQINEEVSGDAIDLLKKMLNPDPNERISIEEVKNHNWIKQ